MDHAPATPSRDQPSPDDLLHIQFPKPARLAVDDVLAESTARQHLRLAATGAAWAVLTVLASATFLVVTAFVHMMDDVIAYAFSDASWMLTPLVALTTTLVLALVVITIALVRSAFSLTTSGDGTSAPDAAAGRARHTAHASRHRTRPGPR